MSAASGFAAARAAHHHGGYPAGLVPNNEICAIAGNALFGRHEASETCGALNPAGAGARMTMD